MREIAKGQGTPEWLQVPKGTRTLLIVKAQGRVANPVWNGMLDVRSCLQTELSSW